MAVTRPDGIVARVVAARLSCAERRHPAQIVPVCNRLRGPVLGATLAGVDTVVHVVAPTDLPRTRRSLRASDARPASRSSFSDVAMRRGGGLRRFDAREGAALGAASAAVAVGATAAIMRRRRRGTGA